MAGLGPSRRSALLDFGWRTAFRLGFRLARIWWRLAHPRHEGALVAVYVGPALLLLRSSYRTGWQLPGGSVRRGETPEAAAQRELAEETGLVTSTLVPAGTVRGIWDGRHDTVNFFELRLGELPELRLDNREIIDARLILPSDLPGMVLSAATAAYLAKSPTAWR